MPMSSALTAPTMKSSIKCTRTLISHCNSIINCAIGNTPTTACAPTSRSPTSPHWNSSPVGKLIGERQSVTNLLDEYSLLFHREIRSIIRVFLQGRAIKSIVERRPPCFHQNACPAAEAFSRPARPSPRGSQDFLFARNPQTPKSPTPSSAPEKPTPPKLERSLP